MGPWSENFPILHFQNDCLMEYMQLKNLRPTEASALFSKYNIFELLSECYDYLHLTGIEYLAEEIADRIERGERFA